MPYEIKNQDGKYCVVKQGSGKVMHCYADKSKAERYMRALYANVPDAAHSASRPEDTDVDEITFTSDFTAEASSASFSGKLFEVGEYPDKDFSLNLEEATDAINEFEPAELEVEHISSLFDGKLGKATNIWFNDENFKDILGEIELNPHIHKVLGNDPIPVSCVFDKNTKKIKRVGLVKNPRVADAAISAAFSAALEEIELDNDVYFKKWTAEARKNLPKEDFGDPDKEEFPIADASDVKDAARLIGHAKNPEAVKKRIIAIAKRKGLDSAIPDDWKNSDKNMSINNEELDNLFAEFKHNTPHGQRVLQQMHNMAAQAGARCKDTGDDASMTAAHEATAMQTIHDTAVKHGASCAKSSAYPSYFNKDSKGDKETMDDKKNSILEEIKIAFNNAFSKPKEETTKKTVKFDANSELAQALIKTEAENFAFRLLREEKIVPAQQEAALALFKKARIADLESGEVDFSKDMTAGSFVKELLSMFDSAQSHGLSKERIAEMADNGAQVLIPTTNNEPTDVEVNERVEKLLGADPVGKVILKKRREEKK